MDEFIGVTLVRVVEGPEKTLGPEWVKESTDVLLPSGSSGTSALPPHPPGRH
jgi:hypothetical protein